MRSQNVARISIISFVLELRRNERSQLLMTNGPRDMLDNFRFEPVRDETLNLSQDISVQIRGLESSVYSCRRSYRIEQFNCVCEFNNVRHW